VNANFDVTAYPLSWPIGWERRLPHQRRNSQFAAHTLSSAVAFVLKGKPKALACDQWTRVEDNLWAIGKHIEALRGQTRWGVGNIAQAFMGYAALPAPAYWWDVLGVKPDAGVEEIQSAYRTLARKHHPAGGGDTASFLRVQSAYEEARKERA